MTTCTFAGHREVYQPGIAEKLDAAISKILINSDNDFSFLVGGMGEFDGACPSAVRRAKKQHPEKRITLSLVMPYLTHELNNNKDYYEQSYDEIIVPMELAGIHYKSAIKKRNQWMVDNSDYLIAFVYRNYGGAYTTLNYARKKNLNTINLADASD